MGQRQNVREEAPKTLIYDSAAVAAAVDDDVEGGPEGGGS